jgi:hypothetical protein
VREVLKVYEAWDGKESVPMKLKELMLIFRIEVRKRYNPYVPPGKTKAQDIQGHHTRPVDRPREAPETKSITALSAE